MKVVLCDKTAEFKALRDTGNELYDPLSNLPVMVVDVSQAGRLLPDRLIGPLQSGISEFIRAVGDEERYSTRFRLVPYSAVGIKMALLPVFRPDRLLIDGCEQKDILVGLCPTELNGNGEYSAVI